MDNIKIINGNIIQVRKLNESDFEQFKNVLYVFKEAPWSEELNDSQVIEEWNSYEKQGLEQKLEQNIGIKNDNTYSVVGTFVNGKMVSMASYTITYGDHKTHVDHGLEFDKNNLIGYISGLATIKEYRGNGYGSMALKALVKYWDLLGIDLSYGRYAVDKDEINLVNENYEDILNGFKYPSKSESIGMLKSSGYYELFEQPGKLFTKDYTNAPWKADKTTEEIRAIAIMSHNKYKNYGYQPEPTLDTYKIKALVSEYGI